MKRGDLVTHAKLAEWGIGVVTAVVDDKLLINFEHVGAKTIRRSVGALTQVSQDLIDPDSWLANPDRWHEGELPPERRSHRTATTCQHCGERLNRGSHSNDRRMKACPRCSVEHGAEHVYYEAPAAYGTSVHRTSDGTPEGTQSYCIACRTGTASDFVPQLCSAVHPQLRTTKTSSAAHKSTIEEEPT